MYYLSLLGTILSNRKNLMELRQPNPGASLKLHGVVGFRGDAFVSRTQLAHCQRSLMGEYYYACSTTTTNQKKQKQKGQDPWNPVFPLARIDRLSTAQRRSPPAY